MGVELAEHGPESLRRAEQVVTASRDGERIQFRAGALVAAAVLRGSDRQRYAPVAEDALQAPADYAAQLLREKLRHQRLDGVHSFARRPGRRIADGKGRLLLRCGLRETDYRDFGRIPFVRIGLGNPLSLGHHHGEYVHPLTHHSLVHVAADDQRLLVWTSLRNVEQKQQHCVPHSGLTDRNIVKKKRRRGLCRADISKIVVSDAKFGKELVWSFALKVGKFRQDAPGNILTGRSLLDESEVRAPLGRRIRDQEI